MYGGAGNDTILGDEQSDVIIGGTGIDSLFGDTLPFGPGADKINSVDGVQFNDYIYGGPGTTDTCDSDPDIEQEC